MNWCSMLSSAKDKKDSDAWWLFLFYLIGVSQVTLLAILIEFTGGLMLSPFSELYALILFAVLVMATHNSRVPVVMASIVAVSILIHIFLGQSDTAAITPHHEDWHYWHGTIFCLVILSMFFIELYQQKKRKLL